MLIQNKNRVLIGIVSSFLLWYIVFLTNYFWSFWFRVTFASIVLAIFASISGARRIPPLKMGDVLKGLTSGLGLYLAFLLGFNMFRPYLFEGAVNVYTFREELPILVPSLLLLITSFCEEYFWRHYIQSSLVDLYDFRGVVIASLFYSAIHLPTLNVPLIAAALLAGFFWGIIYNHTGSLWIVVFSHIAWTELVFVFLPLA